MSLEKCGYKVITANTGKKAIEVFTENVDIDLALIDIDLGAGIDGTQTAEAILKERDIPIIFLTNHTKPEIVEKAEIISSYGYVVKNTGITVLDASIEMALNLYSAKDEIEGFFKANLDLLCIADLEGNFIKVNKEWEAVLGYTAKELQQKKFLEFVHPDDLQATLDAMTILGGQNNVLNFENRYLCKDGSYRFIEWRSHPRGNLIFAAARDITERKQAEEELRTSREKFKAFFSNAQVALFRTSISDGKLIEINQRYAQVAGYSNVEDCLAEFNAANAWTDPNARIKLQRILQEKKRVTDFEAEIIRRDGLHIWILFSATIFPESGTIEGSLIDITERKKTEQELRNLRNYLSNIIDSMPSVLIGVNNQGRVTQWNKEAERLTGVSPDAATGQPLEQAFPRLSSNMEQIREAISKRQVKSSIRQPRKEDNQIHFEDVTIYPLITNGVEGAVVRVDDVTERVRIQEMMIQSEKMLSVGGLAAGMAHEINNPLAGMVQTAAVLNDRLTDTKMPANLKSAEAAGTTMESISTFMELRGIPQMLNDIRESGHKAAEVVTNMLSFARKSDDISSAHDPAELLDKTIELASADYDLKKKYDFRQIEIIRQYDKQLPLIPCEAGKIRQVLLNILRNGAEAMHEKKATDIVQKTDKPRFVLRLSHEPDKEMVNFEIKDNGPGMDEKIRKRVFEPFYTTKQTGQGTGLGLSVSYFIITENHRGEMSVESDPGKGTTFTIKLPTTRNSL